MTSRSESFAPQHPASWVIPDADLYGVDAHGDSVWAVGYWGTVLRSTDAGETWRPAETPTAETLYDVSFADDRHGWAVGANGTLLYSADGGASWVAQAARLQGEAEGARPLDLHLFGVSAVTPETAWAVGDLGAVIRTRDGETWEIVRIPEPTFADDEVPDRILNAIEFEDARHGWIVGEFGTTLRTTDGGETWVGERTLAGTAQDIYLFDVSAVDRQTAATVGLAGVLLVTVDGGATWQRRSTETSAALFGVSLRKRNATAVGDRGVLLATRDLGGTWLDAERPRLFNWLRGVAHASEDRLYAVGEKGLVLRSEDAGKSWLQVVGRKPPPFAGPSVSEPTAGKDSVPGQASASLPSSLRGTGADSADRAPDRE